MYTTIRYVPGADTRRGAGVERADINARKYSVHRQKVTRYSIILVGTMQNRSKWLDFYLPSCSLPRSPSLFVARIARKLPRFFVSFWRVTSNEERRAAATEWERQGRKTRAHTSANRAWRRMCVRECVRCYRVTHPGTLHPVRVRYKLESVRSTSVRVQYFPIFRSTQCHFDLSRPMIRYFKVKRALKVNLSWALGIAHAKNRRCGCWENWEV